MTPSKQADAVRQYYDEDAQYARKQYPTDAQTCNQWGFIARRNHVLSILERVPKGEGRILDIGCGPGIMTPDLLGSGWSVWGLDLSRQMLLRARSAVAESGASNRAGFASANAEHLPFPSGTFDCVLALGVVSYIENLPLALDEIARVLRPGGRAIIQISNKASLYEVGVRMKNAIMIPLSRGRHRTSLARLFDEIRLRAYRPRDFRAFCARSGLEAEESRYYNYALPVLINVAPRAALRLGQRLERWTRARSLPWLAAGYLVALKKSG